MAQQTAVRFVVHHGHAAGIAFHHLTAGGAHAHCFVSATVQKKDGLLAPGQIARNFIRQRPADGRCVARGQFLAHVHQPHLRQRHVVVAFRQLHQRIPARLRGIVAFRGGRGRGQQQQRAVSRGTALRHIVGGIARRALGVIGMLLLFVDDNDSDVRQGRKHSAARAHHDVCAAVLDLLPLQKALGIGERRVLHGHSVSKKGFQAVDHLRRKRNFRHQHQRLAPRRNRLFDEL